MFGPKLFGLFTIALVALEGDPYEKAANEEKERESTAIKNMVVEIRKYVQYNVQIYCTAEKQYSSVEKSVSNKLCTSQENTTVNRQ